MSTVAREMLILVPCLVSQHLKASKLNRCDTLMHTFYLSMHSFICFTVAHLGYQVSAHTFG